MRFQRFKSIRRETVAHIVDFIFFVRISVSLKCSNLLHMFIVWLVVLFSSAFRSGWIIFRFSLSPTICVQFMGKFVQWKAEKQRALAHAHQYVSIVIIVYSFAAIDTESTLAPSSACLFFYQCPEQTKVLEKMNKLVFASHMHKIRDSR